VLLEPFVESKEALFGLLEAERQTRLEEFIEPEPIAERYVELTSNK
jgi:hypothetical protein